jgi:hypothetical protein
MSGIEVWTGPESPVHVSMMQRRPLGRPYDSIPANASAASPGILSAASGAFLVLAGMSPSVSSLCDNALSSNTSLVANVNVEGSTPFARFLSLENTKT